MRDDTRTALDRLTDLPADAPGLAAAVLVGGEVAWQRCVGRASLAHPVPIAPETRFHLVSASKTFTAATVLSLAARGRLALDDDIAAHLPEMALDHGRPVTIRHLLSMTAGIRDQLEVLRLAGEWRPSPTRAADLLAAALADRRTSALPGARFLYVNTNFVLLDEILRRVGGESADATRRSAVYAPIGLARTCDRHHDGIALDGMADPYVAVDGNWLRAHETMGTAGDPVTSTLDDMVRWLASLRSGHIGGIGTLPIMRTPSRLSDGRPIHYGLGCIVRRHRGLTVLGHFGTQPGWKAAIVHLPEPDVGIVLLANREDVASSKLVAAMIDALVPDPPAPTMSTVPSDPALLGDYADPESGEWLSLRDDGGAIRCETTGESFLTVREGASLVDRNDLSAVVPIALTPHHGGLDADLGGARVRLARVPADAARTTDPDDYVGRYEGADIASHHRVTATGDGLAIAYGLGGDRARVFAMRPLGRDQFLVEPTAPGIAHRHVFTFRRDARGRVAGAVATLSRLKDVALIRTG